MDSNHTCLGVISLDSTLKKDENYYPRVFLQECKYIVKKEKVIRSITKDKEFFLVILMKNRLKLNITMFFEEAIFKMSFLKNHLQNFFLKLSFSKMPFLR